MLQDTVEVEFDGAVVHVTGELDSGSAREFLARLASLSGSTPILLDLSEVSFLDSAGLSALMRAIETERAFGRPSSVVTMSEPVHRVLQITGLLDHVIGR